MKPLPLLTAALITTGSLVWWWSRPPVPRPTAVPVDSRPRLKSHADRLRDAMRDTDRGRRSERFARIWNGMTAEDAAALAPDLCANEAGSPFQNDWLEFLLLWGSLDPHAALDFTNQHAGSQAVDWLRAIARGWASIDPHAAAEWWLTGPTIDREGIGSSIVSIWSKTNWEAAAEWVHSRVLTTERPALARAIAFYIVENAPDTAQALVAACQARATPPTELETNIFNSLASKMPIEWLVSLKESFPVPPGLLDRWYRELRPLGPENATPDPRAKEWLLWLVESSHPQATGGGFLHQKLFEHWIAEDPEKASGWLAAQPPSPLRDTFASTLINAMMEEDPEGARQWLISLSAKSQRKIYFEWNGSIQYLIDPKFEAIMENDANDYRRELLDLFDARRAAKTSETTEKQ